MHILEAHPDTPSGAVRTLVAEVARVDGGAFVLHYRVDGDIEAVRIPDPVPYGSRSDELWHTTCFEAFVKSGSGADYLEFNFAPSTAWAAYHFARYRADLQPIDIAVNVIDVEPARTHLDMFITIDVVAVPALPIDEDWLLGLSAVIEEKDGTKSYWALRHPPGAPDFHHPDCFALTLPPPSAP